MAEIKAQTSEKIFSLAKFLGLNQNPDGDTKLKIGEAADMRNWRVTRDGNLQRRPGTKTLIDFETNKPIKGLWCGFVHAPGDATEGVECMLGAIDGGLYILWADLDEHRVVDDPTSPLWSDFAATPVYSAESTPLVIDTDGDVYIFGFNGNAYILDGNGYYQFNGFEYAGAVEGYVPLVYINIPPNTANDESATMENVNRLTLKRRVWISPDGTGDTFQLPEKDLTSIDYVEDLGTGLNLEPSDYSIDTTNGTVTFATAPAQGVNSYEIGYTAGTPDEDPRDLVESMRYAELYAGTQDTRVFLYGNGSNKCIYSGIDYDGNPRADYFPDLYECLVGDSNTPITGMIRHYSRLICFKSNSTWTINATQMTLTDNLSIPAFYVQPVNRTIGNAAMGQVKLVLNSPFTLFGDDLYEWKNRAAYGSNLTSDERQAVRISDRVWATLRGFNAKNCYCYDDNDNQEYYVCHDGTALVYNYASDAWAKYTDFPISCMVNCQGEVYIGSPDGKLKHLSYRWLNDDGVAIDAYWESGSMAFGQDYMRKYAAMLWISIKPETNSEVTVTVQTDKKSNMSEKIVESYLSTFAQMNFARFSFGTNRRPQMRKLKIKAKKFVYYKLIFMTDSVDTRATVLAADIRVRYMGYAK